MLLPAHLHDNQGLEDLADTKMIADQGRKRPVYADSAYRAESHQARAAPLAEEQRESNRKKSMVRTQVEDTFGAQATVGGHVVRTIGLARTELKICMMNLAYNMKRLLQLTVLPAQRRARRAVCPGGVIAPTVA